MKGSTCLGLKSEFSFSWADLRKGWHLVISQKHYRPMSMYHCMTMIHHATLTS